MQDVNACSPINTFSRCDVLHYASCMLHYASCMLHSCMHASFMHACFIHHACCTCMWSLQCVCARKHICVCAHVHKKFSAATEEQVLGQSSSSNSWMQCMCTKIMLQYDVTKNLPEVDNRSNRHTTATTLTQHAQFVTEYMQQTS